MSHPTVGETLEMALADAQLHRLRESLEYLQGRAAALEAAHTLGLHEQEGVKEVDGEAPALALLRSIQVVLQ